MKFEGKKEIVYCEDKLLPLKIGYSLATIYMTDPNKFNRYRLLNFGYCPSDNSFYYNRNIHLPKKLIEYFEKSGKSEKILQEMQEIGICDGSDVDAILKQYNDTKIQNEIAKEKTLNLKRTLKIKKQNK